MIVIGGPAANGVDEGIAKRLRAKLVKAEHKLFSDGESYIRIPAELEGEEVVLVQSTYPPQDTHIMELFLMLESAKAMKPKRIIAVVPYLAYGRQDKRFRQGEALSVRILFNEIRDAGADFLIVVQPHKKESMLLFKGGTKAIDFIPIFAKRLGNSIENPFILAPDVGALGIARRLAKLIHAPYSAIDKTRDRVTGEIKTKWKTQNLKEMNVIVVDDMISSGTTVAMATKTALSAGAKSVTAIAAHLLLVNDAYEKLKAAGVKEIIGTNTIPSVKAESVDVSETISDEIVKIKKQKKI